jgi:hypothetical protein
MERKSTEYSLMSQNLKRVFILSSLLLSFNFIFANVFAPWCAIRRPITLQTAGIPNGCTGRVSIEEVRIQQGSDLLFRKAPDGCSGPHNPNTLSNSQEYGGVINSALNPVVLNAGAQYTISISSSTLFGVSSFTGRVGLWIDYNSNFSFTDASELVSGAGVWNVTAPAGSVGPLSSFTFTVPCGAAEGLTRLRISTDDNNTSHITQAKGCMPVANTPTGRPWYGETEDLYIRIEKSTTLAADFIIPANIYENSPVVFTNINRLGYISHEWDLGLNGYDFTGTDFATVFGSAGTQSLRLRSRNCLGFDSITKSINILSPSSAPQVDFISSKNSVQVGEDIILYDLSTQGPTSWNWQLNSLTNSADDKTNANGTPLGIGGRFNRVLFNMNAVGLFNTCLTVENSINSNNTCKNSFISVTPSSEFILGTNSITALSQGVIYDNGGRSGNYLTGVAGSPANNSFLISPCGATEISLNISTLKFADNSHNLRVWDGINSSGTPLHPQGGFNRTNSVAPINVIATSGAMYLELNTFAGSASDSGLVANFNAILGQVAPPSPAFGFLFENQNFAYTNAVTSFVSKTTNIFGLPSYSWRVDNVAVNPALLSDNGRILNYQFPTSGAFNVCLDVFSCSGDTSFCNTVIVTNPSSPTDLEMTATSVRPILNQTITLSAIANRASNYRWSVSPLSYQLVGGSTLRDKDVNIRFTQPGPYNVSLVAWNTIDSVGTLRAIANDSFIRVVNFCQVSSPVLSEDVGNNTFSLTDNNNNVFYSQSSEIGQSSYENFSGFDAIRLNTGGVYTISMERNTNFNRISRAVYIDWDGDGNFTEAEKVMHSHYSPEKKVSQTFKVPNVNNVLIGTPVRLRAVSVFGTDNPTPCGSLSSGEVEDYTVIVNSYNTPPHIALNGNSLIYVELGTPYVELGAVATDVVEGNISNRINITSNVNTNLVGMYSVNYNVTNAMNIAAPQVSRTVVVTPDNTAPVINLLGSLNDYLEVNTQPYQEPGYTASDNVDGNLTSFVVVSGSVNHNVIGNYTLVYSVNDASGNSATAQRNVEVGDKTKPVINFVGDTLIELGSIWSDLTFVTDNYWSGSDLNFTKTFGFSGPVNPNVRGTYIVNYHVVDGSGNSSSATRRYRVDDFIPPVIVLNTPDTIYHDVYTPYNRVSPTIYDNLSSSSEINTFVSGSVNPNLLGTYVETFTASDLAGNVATATRTVIVVDRVAPSIATPYICTQLFNVFNNKHGIILEDNYYSETELLPLVEITNSNVNIFFEGMYTAAYQAFDPSGNASEVVWRSIEVSRNCEVISSVKNTNLDALVNLYPNPNSGSFTLELGELVSNVTSVEILNSVGVKIYELNTSELIASNNVDLRHLSDGIYSVKIVGNNLNVVKRFILIK